MPVPGVAVYERRENRKCRPSWRGTGNPSVVLSVPFVSGMGLPPFTGTRRMPEPELIPNTSVLSAAQNPDTTEPDILVTICAGPPNPSMVLRLPLLENHRRS